MLTLMRGWYSKFPVVTILEEIFKPVFFIYLGRISKSFNTIFLKEGKQIISIPTEALKTLLPRIQTCLFIFENFPVPKKKVDSITGTPRQYIYNTF